MIDDLETKGKLRFILDKNFVFTHKSMSQQIKEAIRGGPKLLFKKIVKLLDLIFFNLYVIITFLIITPFIILISPIVIVRIGLLESNALGHFSRCVEIYLAEEKLGFHKISKPTIDLWFLQKNISNKFLFKKWKGYFLILPRILLFPLYLIYSKIKFLYKFTTPMRYGGVKFNPRTKHFNMHNDIYNALNSVKPLITFSNSEKRFCENQLAILGIHPEKKIITLHVRDDKYWKDKKNPQSADINTYIKTIKYLIDNGFQVVRMGKGPTNQINFTGKYFIDYSNSKLRSDILDIYLIYKSYLHVGTQSGFNVLPSLFRKPYIQTNVYLDIAAEYGNEDYLFIPKKIKEVNRNKFINLKYIKKNYSHLKLLSETIYENPNLEIIDNTENEILAVVKEKTSKLNGTWKEEMNLKFMQEIYKKINTSLFEDIRLKGNIGHDFLLNNPYLIDQE